MVVCAIDVVVLCAKVINVANTDVVVVCATDAVVLCASYISVANTDVVVLCTKVVSSII